jgi:hypothetical protein
MSVGQVATGDGRFDTSTQPTSICVAESRPPALYSRMMRRSATWDPITVGRMAGSIGIGAEGGGGGEEAMGGG